MSTPDTDAPRDEHGILIVDDQRERRDEDADPEFVAMLDAAHEKALKAHREGTPTTTPITVKSFQC